MFKATTQRLSGFAHHAETHEFVCNERYESRPYTPSMMNEEQWCDYARRYSAVRVLVTPTNLFHVMAAAEEWTAIGLRVLLDVLSFPTLPNTRTPDGPCFQMAPEELFSFRGDRWDPTAAFSGRVAALFSDNPLVKLAGLN